MGADINEKLKQTEAVIAHAAHTNSSWTFVRCVSGREKLAESSKQSVNANDSSTTAP